MNTPETIQVRRYGNEGPSMVVLHGGPGAPGSVAGLARLLSKDYQVLEPLQRRSGQIPLTVDQHVHDLAAVIPNPAILVGHSWGAMLALSYASVFPEAVSSLVLVGCGTYSEETRAQYKESFNNLLGEEGLEYLKEFKDQLKVETDPEKRNRIYGDYGEACMKAESFERIPDSSQPEDQLPVDEEGNVETWNDVLRLQNEGIEPQRFSAISAPVFMIHGDIDPHPGSATYLLLRNYIPQLQYMELARCGHEPWREKYAQAPFLNALRNWLDQVGIDL